MSGSETLSDPSPGPSDNDNKGNESGSSSGGPEHEPEHHHAASTSHEHDHNNDHNHGDHSDGESMPFYVAPRQRQRWSDDQHAPHTDWGDIFFDLFYVAAAYNLGNLLREDPSARGLFYVVGCFFPIMSIWMNKMYYASRFYVVDDIFHRLFEVASLVPLASAVLHIRTVPILSDQEHNVDMFAFSLCITIAHAFTLARSVEIITCQKLFHTDGLYEEAYRNSRRDLVSVGVPTLFHLAAAIYSGTQYYGYNEGDDGSPKYAGESRTLAAAADDPKYGYAQETDVAIFLNLAGALSGTIILLIIVFVVFGGWFGRTVDFQQQFVPMNIDYCIHRYGEWIMLLLGESVLSLLIVDLSEGFDYYMTFFGGIITVILLEYLHFQSQPHDPDQHAQRRSRAAGFFFTCMMWVYSASLIILGTSYKMFLFEFVYADAAEERRTLFPIGDRFLAGGESSALRFAVEDRQQRIAHFFSGSLALVFFCLDATIIAHRGISANVARLDKTWSANFTAAFLIFLRICLIGFAATISQYFTDPAQLAIIGMVCVVCQLILRVLFNFVLPDEKKEEQNALERVANLLKT
mmetsp:Transcript_8215/g.10734  ORF Transcript_8215/g.10734 Transcript_8215/m.10734 type:complete len:577 (+) Transcript_8215:116-1846(+)|eukprot:CAMPEP_0198144240 /NCGR_PEP_ID=MMETSP1443-20131203/14319_1 /TAXON_ID=186043 /ORGANISM="Entomoneis sp., Strain CCMP2396" /LENGTH=576 /DNA_ID=CAMNT_0043807599 /DNA_START=38 /DNA_END=1768 /DNA_ORIENTATION=+